MPVFDFVDKPKEDKKSQCTYTVFSSNEPYADEKHPILILDHSRQEWKHHSNGTFLNQNTQTAFAFDVDGMTINADILRVDARFVSLLKWLGENHSYRESIRPWAMQFTASAKWLLVVAPSYLRRTVFYSL